MVYKMEEKHGLQDGGERASTRESMTAKRTTFKFNFDLLKLIYTTLPVIMQQTKLTGLSAERVAMLLSTMF